MTPTQILALINQYIISNGVGKITGPILDTILTQIVGLSSTPLNFQAFYALDTSTAAGHTTNTYINTTTGYSLGDLLFLVGGRENPERGCADFR